MYLSRHVIVIFFVVCLDLIVCPLSSQQPDFRLTKLDLEINGYIEDFTVDTLGRLWIASINGLYRYDGNELTLYQHDPKDTTSIDQNYISDLYRDPFGTIWISTFGTGVVFFDLAKERFIKISMNESSNNDSRACKSLLMSSSGDLITSSYHGINVVDTAHLDYKTHIHADGAAAPNFIDRMSMINDSVIIVFPRDLHPYIFNTTTSQFQELTNFDPFLNELLSSESQVAISQQGEIWIANCHEVIVIKHGAIQRRLSLNSKLRKSENLCINQILLTKKENEVWFSTDENLFYLDNHQINSLQELTTSNFEFPETIGILHEDDDGSIWFSSFNEIFRIEKNPTPFYNISIPGLADQDIDAIYEFDQNSLLISGWNGLYSYDLSLDQFTPLFMPRQIREETKMKMAQNFLIQDARLLVPMRDYGLMEFNYTSSSGTWNYKSTLDQSNSPLTSNALMYLYEDFQNGLWIGNFRTGIDIVDVQGRFHRFTSQPDDTLSLSSNAISVITHDDSNRIWVATYGGGLNLYIPGSSDFYNGHFKKITSSNSNLSHDVLPYIHYGSDKNLWIATYSGGLNTMNPDNFEISTITTSDGLASNLIYSITEDKNNNLWIATDRGISKIKTSDMSIINYDRSDGLVTDHMNFYANAVLSDGHIILGTSEGLIKFHPDQLTGQKEESNLINTNFYINHQLIRPGEESILNKAIAYTDQLLLTHKESDFGFEFAVIDIKNPENFQYAYQLDGHDDEWIFLGNRNFVNFTNLRPGNYEWWVKAGRNTRELNLLSNPIRIIILPPWWKTWWAYLLYTVVLIASVAIIYRDQKNRWKLQSAMAIKEEKLNTLQKEQEATVLRTMLETTESERQRIAQDLHDSMGGLMSRIKSNVHYITTKVKSGDSEILNTLDLIDTASNEIRRISHDMMPSVLVKYGLKDAIKNALVVLEQSQIQTELETIDVQNDLDSTLSLTLYRIIQESINNVLKHAQAKNVMIQLIQHNECINLIIEDDGLGMVSAASNGIGLESIKSRVQYLNGDLDIYSEQNKGTTISISVPIK